MIYPFNRQDIKRVYKLQPKGWPDIETEFMNYLNKPYCYPFKAEKNNTLIGVGATILYETTAWLAHIIVDETQRKKGVGRTITTELIRFAKNKGYKTIFLIATEMGYPLYKRLGFKDQCTYSFLSTDVTIKYQETSKNIKPFQYKKLHQLLKLDIKLSGEDRSRLIKNHLEGALLYLNRRRIEGYYLPGLGEGLVMAENPNAGIELLKTRLNLSRQISLPVVNQAAIDFLISQGYIILPKKGIRMIMGEPVPWHQNALYSRIGGNYG